MSKCFGKISARRKPFKVMSANVLFLIAGMASGCVALRIIIKLIETFRP